MPHRIKHNEEETYTDDPTTYELPLDHRLELVSAERTPMGSKAPVHVMTTWKVVFCHFKQDARLKAEREQEVAREEARFATKMHLVDTLQQKTVKQLKELANEMLHNQASEDWNNNGDEWEVEPRYAEACMTVEMIDKLTPLLNAYPNRPHHYFGMPSKGWYATDFGGKEQEYAHKVHESTLARFNQNLEHMKTTRVKRDIRFQWYDYASNIQHIVHIITNISGDHFVHDLFTAVDKTVMQLYQEQEEAKFNRWYSKTDEYKQEQAERAQQRRDLATHMGENGYTSFVANDDGTYTTWR